MAGDVPNPLLRGLPVAPKYVTISLEFPPEPVPASCDAPVGVQSFAGGVPADVSPAADASASAIPPGTLPLVIGIITGIAELLKLFRSRTGAAALLALLLLSADATAGPLCQRLRERVAARRSCGQVAPGVAFRAAPAAACPGGACPAPAVSYGALPAGAPLYLSPGACPGGACPAPLRR